METIIRGPGLPASLSSSNTASSRSSLVKHYSALVMAPFLAFPMASGAYAGTGGAITSDSYASKNQWVYDASIHTSINHVINVESVSEQLERVRGTFGLTITDMSFLFDVSRPTMYAWLEGQEPKPEFTSHIAELSDLATMVEAYDLPRVNKLVRRPLRDGSSLLSKIKNGENIGSALAELQATSKAEGQRRQQPKGLQLAKQSAEETINQHSFQADFRG